MDKRVACNFTRTTRKNVFAPPQGILGASFNQANEAKCLQAEFPSLRRIFEGLMITTRSNPCNECPRWESIGPECECFRKYHTAWKVAIAQVQADARAEKERNIRIVKRCPECGLRIRGGNVAAHEQGDAHKRRVAAKANKR